MHTVTMDGNGQQLTLDSKGASQACCEEQREWEYATGRGRVRDITLRPGLNLLVETFDFSCPLNGDILLRPNPVEIFFCISGKMSISTPGENWIVEAGSASLFFTSPIAGANRIFPGDPLKLVTIRFFPDLLCPQVDGLLEVLPPALSQGEDSPGFCRQVVLTPEMKNAIVQILTCTYAGAMRRLFIEAKTLELLLLYFAASSRKAETQSQRLPPLNPGEIGKIHLARQILGRDFENPPRLVELARQVGLNKDKLNQGFHLEFGCSVFGCFRRQKMEAARQWLAANEMNITQAAYALGYAQPGTFSRAFKHHFGISPKDFRSAVRR